MTSVGETCARVWTMHIYGGRPLDKDIHDAIEGYRQIIKETSKLGVEFALFNRELSRRVMVLEELLK